MPDSREIPLATTVQSILDDWTRTHDLVDYELVVTHPHGHNDHTRAVMRSSPPTACLAQLVSR